MRSRAEARGPRPRACRRACGRKHILRWTPRGPAEGRRAVTADLRAAAAGTTPEDRSHLELKHRYLEELHRNLASEKARARPRGIRWIIDYTETHPVAVHSTGRAPRLGLVGPAPAPRQHHQTLQQARSRPASRPPADRPASSCRRSSIQMRTWWTAFRMLPPASETPRSIGASATTDSADIRPHPARSLPQAVTWAVSRGPSRPRGSRPSSPRPHAAAPASRARTCPSSSRSASGRGSP